MDRPNRRDRRAARAEGRLDDEGFLKVADHYNAHVAKSVLDVADHETFVAEMSARFTDMLRQHLADPSLGGGEANNAD